MQNIRLIVGVIVGVWLMTGCSDETNVPQDKVALQISKALSGAAETPIAGGELGLYMKQNPNYTQQSNVRFRYVTNSYGGAWMAADEKNNIWLSESSATMAAYYPYNKNQPSTGTAIDLTPAVRKGDSGSQDIWYGSFTAHRFLNLGQLSPMLKQAYSRVRLSFVRSETYQSEVLLYGLSMHGVYTSAKLELFSSSATYTGQTGFVPIYYYGDLPIGKKGSAPTAVLDMLMIPQTFSAPILLTTTIAQWDINHNELIYRSMDFELKPSDFENKKIEAGRIYDITITVSGRDISATGAFLRKEEWVLDSKDLGDVIINI